ncbi:MerR family transcriptional regulator [Micromonospora sp. NPDC000207]|uniref:MerR family transcriptional regulator n=1 Tax=Micromonospora sp. NPDC000207 TaxID=3154246 RepID=UPI00332D7BD9
MESGWRIGELCRRTGLTVRTLHHWDHVGLLRPSTRTSAGHRRYDERDVDRLYRIVALRELGLSLETIAALLDGDPEGTDPAGPRTAPSRAAGSRATAPGTAGSRTAAPGTGGSGTGGDLVALLRDHLAHVDRQLAALGSLRHRLAALLPAVQAAGRPTSVDLLAVIEEVKKVENTMRNYFTEEQMGALEQRRATLGEEAIRAVEQEWPRLIAQVQAEMEAGTEPTDPRVRPLAQRWMELLAEFHGNDPGLRDSLYKMYGENADQIRQEYSGPSPEMIEYITRASATD